MLTITMEVLEDDIENLHPFTPIAITLIGSDGKNVLGRLEWGLLDLNDFAAGLERFSVDLRAKKYVFDSMERPFQIIWERRKHSMVVIFANGYQIDALKEAEAYLVFADAFVQFYTKYYQQMAQTEDASSDLVSYALAIFEKECQRSMSERKLGGV